MRRRDSFGWKTGDFERRKWWRRLFRPHIGPKRAVHLFDRVRDSFHLVFEVAVLGLVRHVDARAIHVELPAVIDAAQAALLVASPEEIGTTVWAVLFEQANLAIGVAEG